MSYRERRKTDLASCIGTKITVTLPLVPVKVVGSSRSANNTEVYYAPFDPAAYNNNGARIVSIKHVTHSYISGAGTCYVAIYNLNTTSIISNSAIAVSTTVPTNIQYSGEMVTDLTSRTIIAVILYNIAATTIEHRMSWLEITVGY
jgi:hypothetical protein